MSSVIHSSAVIDPGASIGENVSIGPFTVVEKDSVIGDDCEIGSHVFIGRQTTLGKTCRIFHGASVGTIAQDLKYKGEEVTLTIGDNTIIREFCTINRGTAASGTTIIGSNCALLAYAHVAHDCAVGDNVIMSNNATLGGHVVVENNVGIGAFTPVHQFCRIGVFAFIGARSLIVKDVIPFSLCAAGGTGTERIVDINKIGLERNGFDSERRLKIKRAFRVLFRDGLTVKDALLKLDELYNNDVDIKQLISFIKKSERGIYNMNV